MLVLRFLAVIVALAIGAAVATWVFTGDRRYLRMAWKLAKAALIVALLLFALLAAERIIVI